MTWPMNIKISIWWSPKQMAVLLKVSNGDIKSVQGDTGHAVSNMVTDVYSHIFDANCRHLAKQVDEQFFAASDDKNSCTP